MKKKILLIEDDEPVLETLKNILENKGYDVSCASNAKNALSELGADVAPDWIIMDYEVRGLNPDGFVKKVRLAFPKSKIILSSGYSEKEISKEFRLSSVDKFIAKPFNPIDLLDEFIDIKMN